MTIPACMFWPVPDERIMSIPEYDDAHYSLRMHAWQAGRCAIDGAPGYGDLVLDHSHDTGLIRGLLCRGCNGTEAHSVAEVFTRYRAGWNPAALLGVFEAYISPFTGQPVVRDEPADDASLRAIIEAVA